MHYLAYLHTYLEVLSYCTWATMQRMGVAEHTSHTYLAIIHVGNLTINLPCR
jgi:hypothetical protein